MYATSSTPFCYCHGGQDCLNPFTATREMTKSSEEDTVKQITLTATFQMILELGEGVPDDPFSDHLDAWE